MPDNLPSNTVELHLGSNNIKSLSDHDLADCTRLLVLDVARNGLSQIAQKAFSSTTNLQKLILNDNNISTFSLPSGIFDKLGNLKVLYLHNNIWSNAKNYPDFLNSHLSRLERLSIDGIPGIRFTSGFSQLRNLSELSVYGGIDIVTNDTFAVFSNSSLTKLKIQTDTLHDLQPMSFAFFPFLETLDLSYNTGLGLPNASRAWWGLQFTNITKLVLTGMTPDGIAALPLTSEFFLFLNLTKITVLMVDRNNIVDMPPMLSKSLKYLEHLDLSYNRISDVASLILDLWMLKYLRYIDISHQAKRYVGLRYKKAVEQPASLYFKDTPSNSDDEYNETKADFFQRCETPPMKPCSNLRIHASKFPLPAYGTWCLPIPPKIEVIKLSESLNVNYKNLPSIIIFGGAHIKFFEYRLNGLERLRGPFIISQPVKNAVFDFSDNKFSCISPDALTITVKYGSIITQLILSGNRLSAQMEADVNGITFKDLMDLDKLDLANNGIKKLSVGIFSQLSKIKVLNLSQNSLRQIDFEFSHMKTLKMLDISYNLLTTLQESTMQKFAALMESMNLSVSLLGNPIQCSCETYDFLQLINQHRNQFTSFVDYTCLYKGNVVPFSNLTELVMVDLNFQCSLRIAVIMSACLLGLLLTLIAVTICCYRYRWELRYFCMKLAKRGRQYHLLVDDETFTYDAFVVYSCEDGQWVNEELVPQLENGDCDGQLLRLCIHERDFGLGENIIRNIWNKMEESRKVILVISNNFVSSNWCKYEIDLARMIGVEKARNLLVPVFLETVRMADMSDSLGWIVRKLTYIEWPQWPPDRDEFWRRLRDAIIDNDSAGLPPPRNVETTTIM